MIRFSGIICIRIGTVSHDEGILNSVARVHKIRKSDLICIVPYEGYIHVWFWKRTMIGRYLPF